MQPPRSMTATERIIKLLAASDERAEGNDQWHNDTLIHFAASARTALPRANKAIRRLVEAMEATKNHIDVIYGDNGIKAHIDHDLAEVAAILEGKE